MQPKQHLPGLSKGPRIMDRNEEDEFYQGYVEELALDDLEQDPRQWRISPATFSQWAAGAVTGDLYHTKEDPVNVKVSRFIVFRSEFSLFSRLYFDDVIDNVAVFLDFSSTPRRLRLPEAT